LEEYGVSFSLVWLLFLQCVDPQHCWLIQKTQQFLSYPSSILWGAGVVLGGGARTRRVQHLVERC